MSDPKLVLDDVNIYYGDFHAVQKRQPHDPCASGYGVYWAVWLRQIHRAAHAESHARGHPRRARVAGKIVLDGRDIYAHNVDPVAVRMNVGMNFRRRTRFRRCRSKKTWLLV